MSGMFHPYVLRYTLTDRGIWRLDTSFPTYVQQCVNSVPRVYDTLVIESMSHTWYLVLHLFYVSQAAVLRIIDIMLGTCVFLVEGAAPRECLELRNIIPVRVWAKEIRLPASCWTVFGYDINTSHFVVSRGAFMFNLHDTLIITF